MTLPGSCWNKDFGDPFIIGKSIKDKLHGWPKISSKVGCELREFTDFLKSCATAMRLLKTLEIPNDCNENKKNPDEAVILLIVPMEP